MQSEQKIKVALATLGCKVNYCESAALDEDFRNNNFLSVPFNSFADVYIINTCTVTAYSDYQSRQLIRRAKKINRMAKIIVTGCYAQIAPGDISRIEGVNLIVGNSQKIIIPQYINNIQNNSVTVMVDDIFAQKEFCYMPVSRFTERTRAFLKIQDGCNSLCSYCIIPFARGRSRSMSLDKVISAVTQFIQQHYLEIVLTGIHLGYYGQDLSFQSNLTYLLKRLIDINGNARFRLSSIEPREITDELINIISEEKSFCRHLHIPLQSGDDNILASMNRDYDSHFYRQLIEKIMDKIEDIAIGVDVMVGFPGEGTAQFNNTFKLLSDLPVAYLHVFPYSERPHTAAQKIYPKVPDKTKKERAATLRNLSLLKREKFASRFLGKKLKVLVEQSKDKKTGFFKGFSDNYLPFLIQSKNNSIANTIVEVHAEKFADGKFYGKISNG
ncbi:MAG TPA: tRNA (N(6)-L-threonylcarbamoyladenosine(37)-C(2))-methylthiotransferase MtaB [Deltaproteobacteria bacterium]|nr:tRNA (N(6)-L-threonylcarbamoyladenosine(37)-C(2))-methylthiotransferase MtaB [Deltaproteobacteria bacterium]